MLLLAAVETENLSHDRFGTQLARGSFYFVVVLSAWNALAAPGDTKSRSENTANSWSWWK
jgi:hypothetical protein